MTGELDIIRNIHEKAQRETRSPDLAYAVRVNGADLAVFNGDQQFRIASMTKSFTAAAILLLRDHRALTLDTTVAQFVPELESLQLPTTDSAPLTIRDLLTMSAGIANDDPWGDRQIDISQEEMSQLLHDGAYFSVPPGVQFLYSNYGYAILGRVVANVSGMVFSQFVVQELLQPLDMHRTSWDPVDDMYARPHRLQDDAVIIDPLEPLRDGAFSPMAGLWSTARDLLTWCEFMIDAFPPRNDADKGPLRRSSRREMQQIHRYDFSGRFAPRGVTRASGAGYGMGLLVLDDPKLGQYVFHPGGLPGYGSSMGWLPNRNACVVGLANITYAPMRTSSFATLDSLDDLGVIPPTPAPLVPLLEDFAQRLIALFNDWDDTAADEIFAMNVPLDLAYERRRKVLAQYGSLKLESVTPLNLSLATAKVLDTTNNLELRLRFSLTPERRPRLQAYSLEKVES